MKELSIRLAFFLFACGLAVGDSATNGKEYVKAFRNGAQAKFTFRVVDEDGAVVTGAYVQASFATEWSKWIKGASGTNGLFSVEGRSRGEMIYDVRKNGYYSTSDQYHFGGLGGKFLSDGKWLPWNPTNTVVIKKIKNPVAMFANYEMEMFVPEVGKAVSYDLAKGDWLHPYGKGEAADIIVLYEYTEIDSLTFSRNLTLTFGTNALDGVRRYKKDTFSKLCSIYEAPETGYERSLSWAFEHTKKTIKDTGDSKDECLVFRVRTQVDDKGNIVKANYGKIYGPIDCWRGKKRIKFVYYFNPEFNSRNLEFDPTKNLSGQKVPMP